MSTCLSVRKVLLVSVSTLALSIASANVRAADMPLKARPAPAFQPGVLTMWMEGAAFWTGGKDSRGDNLLSTFSNLSGGVFCTAGGALCPLEPTNALKMRPGWEFAAGADWQFAASPWHLSFNVRYGFAKAKDQSIAHSHFTTGGGGGRNFFSTKTNAQYQARESHLVADFMIGRDIGIGLGQSQVKVGVRVADLQATIDSQGNHFINGFCCASYFGSGGAAYHTAAAIAVRQRSKFLGVGPRAAIEGGVAFGGQWAVDYMAGVAVLFGDRRLQTDQSFISGGTKFTTFTTQSTTTSNSNGSILNADASAALSYWLTPRAKVSAGFRFDGYWSALRTLDVNGNVVNVDRFYYGPFLRLTGQF